MSDLVSNPSGSNVKTALVDGALATLLVWNVYLFVQLHDIKAESVKARDSIQAKFENLKENSTVATAASRAHLNTLKEDLENARHQANLAAGQAKREALTHAEQLAQKIEQEQQQQQKKVLSEISEVKEAASTANTKLADVSGEVRTVKSEVSMVKSEVASTKTELDKAISDLTKVAGDLGVTSGYLATNAKELSALKRLNERNYAEFHLSKTKPQRIGDVSIQLKKTDPKRNKFTLDVLVDDKKTEKKDRTVNEPVQFYVAKARQPHELVVNEVKKDMIVGYLSAPKEQVARN